MSANIKPIKNISKCSSYFQENLQGFQDYHQHSPVLSPPLRLGSLLSKVPQPQNELATPQAFQDFLQRKGLPIRNKDNPKSTKAFDIVLPDPKDLSLVWALRPDLRPQIQAARDEGLRQFLQVLETYATKMRRGAGGAEVVPGQGLETFCFDHGTARPVRGLTTMSLHRHIVTGNKTRDVNGNLGTLHSRELFRWATTAEAVYQQHMARSLGQMGFQVQRHQGHYRIEGITEPVRKAFSPRSQQIARAVRDHQGTSRRAFDVAAVSTRARKDTSQNLSDLMADWVRRAARYGLSAKSLEAFRMAGQHWQQPPMEIILRRAERQLEQKTAHFGTRHFLKAVFEEAIGTQHRTQDLQTAALARLQDRRRIHYLGEKQGEARYTTTATLRLEEELLARCQAMASRTSRPVSTATIEKVLRQRPHLQGESRRALQSILSAGDLSLLTGPPGVGKSTLAEGIAAGLKKSGYKQILAVSVSAQAADNLGKKAHINSVTVAKLLGSRELHFKGDLQRGWGSDLLHHIRMIGRAAVGKKTWKPPRTKFNKRTALIIDEASMLSSEAFHSLTRAAHKKGTRIILLGDERQLSSPGGVGGPFRHLQNMPDIPKASLTRIVRQNDPQARANVLDLWRGKVNQVLDRLREKGDLQVIRGGREAARQALIATWKKTAVARPKDHLILASTREEVKALNLAAQQARLEAGKLGLVLARTPNYKLRMGDRVRITRNNRKLGLFNGTLGTIDGLTFRGIRSCAWTMADAASWIEKPRRP